VPNEVSCNLDLKFPFSLLGQYFIREKDIEFFLVLKIQNPQLAMLPAVYIYIFLILENKEQITLPPT